jgi:hypothetical protein
MCSAPTPTPTLDYIVWILYPSERQ